MGKLIKKPRGNVDLIKPTMWKKGQSGNPAGRPKTPEDVRIARKLTHEEFARICMELFCVSTKRLVEITRDDSTPVMTALVARILEKGIHESSRVELNYFVERFLGKVPEQANVTGDFNGTLADFIAARNAAKPKPKDEDDEDFV